MRFILVTGLSGAGKSQAKFALEDLGYFCVDNIPPALIPGFADYMASNAEEYRKTAIVVDIRGGKFFGDLEQSLQTIAEHGHTIEILFVESGDETLLSRFKENRRKHPLESADMSFSEALAAERAMLEPIRRRADWIINTDTTTNSQLRNKVAEALGISPSEDFLVTLASFGFKYGIMREADFVFDMRYLPNPYYDKDLRNKSGNDADVRDYVMNSAASKEMYREIKNLLETVLPLQIQDGRRGVCVAFGCTGGRHRSVTFAVLFAEELRTKGYKVKVLHRDLME